MLAANLRLLAPLALVLLLAASCGGSKKGTATTPNAPPNATTTGTGTTTVPMTTTATTTVETGTTSGGSGEGTLLMNNHSLFPLLSGSLSRFVPTQVEGKGLKVVALGDAETLWAGRSRTESLLVHIHLKGKIPPHVKVGQKVDFVGQLTGAAGPQAAAFGVRNPADGSRLAKQGAYVEVSVLDLKIH
jgi:hypothetical protein